MLGPTMLRLFAWAVIKSFIFRSKIFPLCIVKLSQDVTMRFELFTEIT